MTQEWAQRKIQKFARSRYQATLTLGKRRQSPASKLTEFPLELLQFESLEILTIYHQKLSSLPPELTKLTNLISLSLEGNDFTHIPEVVFELIRV